ncbi:MAG: bifunctional methionine sulfoxide reductase B/A protein, partial [Bacteroidales bacterium]|nr:bifunctional methionine sulfoxide reductase B/A protein [Bacteroidales bacterium]
MSRLIILLIFITLVFNNCNMNAQNNQEYNKLSKEEQQVILNKGTEAPYTGKYVNNKDNGIYSCKRCDTPLYNSSDKFDSHCGWPSFDDEIEGAIERKVDADGSRTEILCANCGAHLGHVFEGENYTEKNSRHCVNSISLNFDPINISTIDLNKPKVDTAIFAGGCFWGMEYYFQKKKGVLSTQVGYTGGSVRNPSYEQVCSGGTGHIEALKVEYNPEEISYEDLAKLFFEIHDPAQVNRQGPDIGEQYKSAVFCINQEQKETIIKLVKILENNGVEVATEIHDAEKFWQAELKHQKYYQKTTG